MGARSSAPGQATTCSPSEKVTDGVFAALAKPQVMINWNAATVTPNTWGQNLDRFIVHFGHSPLEARLAGNSEAIYWNTKV